MVLKIKVDYSLNLLEREFLCFLSDLREYAISLSPYYLKTDCTDVFVLLLKFMLIWIELYSIKSIIFEASDSFLDF